MALIILLLRLSEHEAVETSSPLRILVSAQTNVAVDNILQVILSSFEIIVLALLSYWEKSQCILTLPTT